MPNKENKRLDEVLVEAKIVSTRAKAKQLILNKKVLYQGEVVTKPGRKIAYKDQVSVLEVSPYVGRGAYKIKSAYDHFKFPIKNLVAADIGASTGGFSDFLLQNGLKKVYCVDVGSGQLDSKLRNDSRVVNMEGINVKKPFQLKEKVDFMVVDLSYISVLLVIENLLHNLKPGGFLIILIKPQFEAGKNAVGKDGVLKSPELGLQVTRGVLEDLQKFSLNLLGYTKSRTKGKKGNQEYLAYLKLIS
jgi:23S rRNA (cytidine1920-2'-O)/16S rRNA (cytidine1409-2'-O)-methyltransferase